MNENKKLSIVQKVSLEIKKEISDPAVARALLATTFKGLDENLMKQALMEGMIKGFSFKNFLEKDIYAIPFGKGYSLITSIDYSRKTAMRTKVYLGKSSPCFELDNNNKVDSCTVTVKKLLNGIVGDFSATVYFAEYTKNRDLWVSKPKTMIAKVAEMHALRMAFPEELSQTYIEEEINVEDNSRTSEVKNILSNNNLQMGKFLVNKNENKINTEEENITNETKKDNSGNWTQEFEIVSDRSN